MAKWDKGVQYEAAYRKILNHMSAAKLPARCYDAVLLIQLRNGARLSEAIRAFKQFLRSKQVELRVLLSKKKKHEERLMVIPREVIDVVGECNELVDVDDKVLSNRIKNYCRATFKFNTHSLRYAFITYLLRQNINPSIIAKLTGHTKLDYILVYTQTKTAEEILRSLS